jgi:hypothetical protein
MIVRKAPRICAGCGEPEGTTKESAVAWYRVYEQRDERDPVCVGSVMLHLRKDECHNLLMARRPSIEQLSIYPIEIGRGENNG